MPTLALVSRQPLLRDAMQVPMLTDETAELLPNQCLVRYRGLVSTPQAFTVRSASAFHCACSNRPRAPLPSSAAASRRSRPHPLSRCL